MSDTDDPDCPPYIPGSPRLILTAQGIAKLAEHGHLPNVQETMIAEKSRADFVAKLLAILQASWILIQCIARWKAHLTMTLLELNTLAHTICALLMYLLWMNKPYDVHEPIRISGEWVRPLCATLWMFSHISTEKHWEDGSKITDQPEIERLLVADVSHLQSSYPVRQHNFENNTEGEVTASAENKENSTLPPLLGGDIELGLERSIDALPSTSMSNVKSDQSAPAFVYSSNKSSATRYRREAGDILDNEMCPEIGFSPKQESDHFKKRNVSRSKIPHYITPPVQIDTTGITLTRWRLASAVLRENGHIWGQYATPNKRIPEVEAGCPIYEYKAKDLNANFIDPQIKDWPGNDLLGREDKFLRSLLLSLATAAYGGIHASAWNQYFVTPFERHAWRFSSVFISASGLVMSLRTIGSRVMQHVDHVKGCLVVAVVILAIPSASLAVYASYTYVVARSYLVVEALFSLRQLPINAYQTPRFVQFIPHL